MKSLRCPLCDDATQNLKHNQSEVAIVHDLRFLFLKGILLKKMCPQINMDESHKERASRKQQSSGEGEKGCWFELKYEGIQAKSVSLLKNTCDSLLLCA